MRRGLATSRREARAEIGAGRVLVGGAPAAKPARLVGPGEPVVVLAPPPRFVGRGGEKLDAALDALGTSVAGLRCLDAGASTGGFTDCLLQRGAAEVVAVDVGRGQLHQRLRTDPRVRNLERTDVRCLRPGTVGGPADVVVADLSFISLDTVLPVLVDLTTTRGELVVLVKPQFEAGRAEAGRGRGVISDPRIWRRVLEGLGAAGARAGTAMMGVVVSPLTGAEGNVEFFAHLRPATGGGGPSPGPEVDLDAVVDEAVRRHGG